MVQGRTAYMVACGPRMKGSKPGSVSAYGSSEVSVAVYRGFTAMPSGVCQFKASRGQLGEDFAAALRHCSRVADANSFCGDGDIERTPAGLSGMIPDA